MSGARQGGIGPAQMVGQFRGRWLVLARWAWTAVVAVVLGSFLVSVPIGLRLLEIPCQEGPCITDQLTAEGVAALTSAGLSPRFYAAYNTALAVSLAAVFSSVAAVIAWRRSDEPVALFVSLTLVLLGVYVNTYIEALDALGLAWALLVDVLQAAMWVAFPVLLYIFPDGRFVPRWTILMVGFWGYVQAAYFVALLYPPAVVLNPGDWPLLPQLALYVTLLFTGLYAPVYRYRHVSSPAERQQTKWVVFGLVCALVVFLLAGLLPSILAPGVMTGGRVSDMALDLLGFAGLSIIPITFGVAILRFRLWDIDLLIRRTLTYSLLTAGLAAAYFASVLVLQSLLGVLTGERQSALITVLSTLAIAGLFSPLRRRIQAFIDRRFYRRKYDAALALAAFGEASRDDVDLDTLTNRLLAVVAETVQPEHVGLWLKPANK